MNSPGSHTPLERASLHHPHAVLRKLHPHISMELDPGHSSITANCPAWPSDLNTNKPERYRAASADGAQDRVGRGLSVGAAWRTATPESWPETPWASPSSCPGPPGLLRILHSTHHHRPCSQKARVGPAAPVTREPGARTHTSFCGLVWTEAERFPSPVDLRSPRAHLPLKRPPHTTKAPTPGPM